MGRRARTADKVVALNRDLTLRLSCVEPPQKRSSLVVAGNFKINTSSNTLSRFPRYRPRYGRRSHLPDHCGVSGGLYRRRRMAASVIGESMYQHEKLAGSILARDGIAAIWKLEVAAADAYRTGH